MKKRIISALLLVAMVLTLLAACSSNKAITADDAKQIVMEELGLSEEQASQMHVHIATHDGVACYSVYVTVGGVSMEYLVHGKTGEIISSGEGSHSH